MKRSQALKPLSRDHHGALVVAQQLRRATEAEPARQGFLAFWREDGRKHFRVEEEVLLPVWALHGEVDREAVGRMLDDHLWIRRQALVAEQAEGALSLDDLHELGERLAAHVRFEERELFEAIEAALDEEALADLAARVIAAEAREPGAERD
jgi:hypothetical protein